MVVFGGLYLLDSDDEEEGQQSSETAAEERRRERARPTPPVMAYLTPRPWVFMYNRYLPIPESSRDKKEKLGLIQKLLPEDAMREIFKRMTPVAVSRAACCCRAWRLMSAHEDIWEKACYDAWRYREESEDTARIARDRYHGSWRHMFFHRVRLRTEGIYVSRNTYVKPGVTDWDNLNPVHLVCYYRYYRFFSNGEFLCKTSPHKLAHVHKTFKSRYLAAKDSAMFHGGFKLACKGDETRLHLECVPHTRPDFTFTTLHMWLRLRSTHPGGSNRLDFVKLASVDNEMNVPHPSEAQWVEVDDPELAYRRSCGINVKRYNGTLPVNELSRGLNTLVFVPWEDVHDHVLNLSTDKMDFFVTG